MKVSRAQRTLKLTIAYDGTHYAGWQRQDVPRAAGPRPPTIQAALERVLRRILQERVTVVGSGRTDSGVHALAQVAHVRASTSLPPATVQRALNSLLPPDIAVTQVQRAPKTFHARFSAKRKRYRYRLVVGPCPSPFNRHYAYHVRAPLNVAAMRQAARWLKGRHDFRPFQAAGTRVTATVRHVTDARWLARDGEWWFEIEADGFLYKMVRRIAGTLVDIGRGKHAPALIRHMLQTGDTRRVGPTLPPHGLVLVSVTY